MVLNRKVPALSVVRFGPDTSYSGLSEVQARTVLCPDRRSGGVRSGETLSFDTSKRTWYEAAGPVWMIAGRDIVASGTHLGQPTAVQPEEMGVGQEGHYLDRQPVRS
jgi:hypothetical protein